MKKYLLIGFLYFFTFCGFAQEVGHCDISDIEAIKHLGEELTVCGRVSQVYIPKYTTGNPVYINFGQSYPNQTFSIVIWGEDAEKYFSDAMLKFYQGKNLSVYGKIKDYNGKPQIRVKSRNQIKVLEQDYKVHVVRPKLN